MRLIDRPSLRQVVAWTLALAIVACTEHGGINEPPTSSLFTTPTGLVTANPPEIFVGAGDIASCGNDHDEETATLLDNIPGTVFALGDNVYENGTTSEFNNCYDPTWGRHKARTKPAAGNHEYNTTGATPYYQYFGAAAGDPAKGYYSFDLGAWHVIVLNSEIDRTADSPQLTWLRADLTAHQNLCTVAYWHKPLYYSISDAGSGGGTSSSNRPFYDALYEYGADLVMAGHRHHYERMAPMKPDGTRDNVYGLRQFIVGGGGRSMSGPTNLFPLTEVVAPSSNYGVLKLYLYEDSYAWKYVPIAGKTFSDSGSTACHGVPGSGGSVSASRSTVSASPATITASNGTSVSTITVTARDANGNPVSGVPVVLSVTGSGNTLTQPTGPTNANGVATGTLSSTAAGSKTVSATAGGVAITQAAPVTVSAAAATSLVFIAQPSNTAAGATIAPAVQVDVRDQFGNRVNGSHSVALVLGSNPSGGILAGTTIVAAVAGVASFGDLSIDKAGSGYTLTASAAGLTGATSSAFDITGPVPNSAPTASNVTVSGTTTVGQLLTGNYTYSDAEGDAEGASTYRWLRNGAAITGATAKTYTLVAADQGTLIVFEVTPVAATGTSPGAPVRSAAVGPVAAAPANSAPIASNVTVTGTTTVGQLLTGNYTYSDAEGDAEGASTYRWLRNGAAIGGATAKTYTLVAADQGALILFEVTPFAATGTSPGAPVQSAAVGPVAAAPVVTVAGISPNTMANGSTVSVTVSGSGFAAGARLTFESGSGPTPTASNVVVGNASTITATVTAKSGGPPRNRLWSVRVTNSDGSTGVLVGGLTVTP